MAICSITVLIFTVSSFCYSTPVYYYQFSPLSKSVLFQQKGSFGTYSYCTGLTEWDPSTYYNTDYPLRTDVAAEDVYGNGLYWNYDISWYSGSVTHSTGNILNVDKFISRHSVMNSSNTEFLDFRRITVN